MRVVAMVCESCSTEVKSSFAAPKFLELSSEQQRFATDFILAGGSLKDLAAKYEISYPTVRARLDRLIECLQGRESAEAQRLGAILDAVEEKKISSKEASHLLNYQEKEGSNG